MTLGGDQEQSGDEPGILQNEEEIGQAGKRHALRIDEHIGKRPGSTGNCIGKQAERGTTPGSCVRLTDAQEVEGKQGHHGTCGHANPARSQSVTGPIQGGWSKVTLNW